MCVGSQYAWLYCDVDGTLGCVLCTLEKPGYNRFGIGLYSSKTPQKMPKNDDFEQAIFLVFLSAKVEID